MYCPNCPSSPGLCAGACFEMYHGSVDYEAKGNMFDSPGMGAPFPGDETSNMDISEEELVPPSLVFSSRGNNGLNSNNDNKNIIVPPNLLFSTPGGEESDSDKSLTLIERPKTMKTALLDEVIESVLNP